MNIVAGLQVFEEIDFIEPCLHSCCNTFDQVVVVEGSWNNTREIAGDRSRDGTIEKIQDLEKIYDNLELFFFNGDNQISHRQFIWEKCKTYKPHWYLQGDGDEIFHEKDKQTIKETLSQYHALEAVAPEHYLFWHDLEHYEPWNTAGARFFNVDGINLDQVHAGPQCNSMYYNIGTTNAQFRRHTTNNFYIYHPSYVKNSKRQKLKIDHRSADDNNRFPHFVKNDKMYRGGKDIKSWLKSLQTLDVSKLPQYLKETL